MIFLIFGFLAIMVTLFSIESNLRKTVKQNDGMIELLEKQNRE